MKDSQIKSKIARIVIGALKSTLKDHPEYLDGNRIKKSAMSSVAKRSAGHILRLLRMHAVTNTASEHADSPFSKALAANLKLMAKREFTHDLEPALGPENLDKRAEDFEGMPPIKELPKCTGKLLPMERLDFMDWGSEAMMPTLPLKELDLHSSLFDEDYPGKEPFDEQMIEDMKDDVPEELERRRTLNNKPRC